MRIGLLGLLFIGVFACKTKDAVSQQKGDVSQDSKQKARGNGHPTSAPTSLLKWREGRWSLQLKDNVAVEKMDKPGKVVCDVTNDTVSKELGAEQTDLLQKAIAELYKIKDKRQFNPIFRGLDEARELVAIYEGKEFLVEKMYQNLEVISPEPAVVTKGDKTPRRSPQEKSLEMVRLIANNPLVCSKIPH